MKEIKVRDIANMKNGELLEAFFIVKSCEQRPKKNGEPYLNLILGDATGSIDGKKWEFEEKDEGLFLDQCGNPAVIKGKFAINDHNGNRQLILHKWRRATKEDNLDKGDFLEKAPEDSQEMYDYIRTRASQIGDDDLKRLCLYFIDDEEYKNRLLYYPAAVKFHHSYYGGLLYHMKRMLMTADRVCEVYDLLNPDWLACGVILHDIQKMNEIHAIDPWLNSDYSKEGKLLGHLVMGVREIANVADELNIDAEKALLVEHMILAHHQEPEFGSPVRPAFPEAEVLHHLDNLDAKIFDMENALVNTEAGDFSERVWTLNNRQLYKREDD